VTHDPHSPDYVPPEASGTGTQGKGTEFGADLYALYYAGQLQIPTTAGHYSEAVGTLHWISGTFAGIAGDLAHSAGDHVLANMRDLEHAMRASTRRLYDAADALVSIADRYAATDGAASDEFTRLLGRKENGQLFDNPPGTHLPPGADDPVGDPPDLPADETELQEILDDAGIEDAVTDIEDEQEDD
jgi:hypothetical protein